MIRNAIVGGQLLVVGPYVAVPVKHKRNRTYQCDGCWFHKRGVCTCTVGPWFVPCKKAGVPEFRYVRAHLGDLIVDTDGQAWVIEPDEANGANARPVTVV